MFWKLIKTLKPVAIITAIVTWNVLCLTGIWLNGGMGKLETPGAVIAMVSACGLLSVMSFLVATSATWQRIALRPGSDPRDPRPALLFLSFLGAALAVGGAVSVL